MLVNGISSINFQSSENFQNKKPKLTDNFQTKIKNSADMNDCISVPRTIFKGYLGIMAGTSLMTAATLFKPSKARATASAAGIATSLYGTWAFVRPYILEDSALTVKSPKI